MQNTYYGNFLGIVVQNNDPEKRGRIKIWVPHISAVLYDKWNKQINDKSFVFPDNDTNPDLTNIMDDLKAILPWAECASPLFGGCASGRYNDLTKKGSTSDSNYWDASNKYVEGNRPLQNYIGDNVYPDAFKNTNNVKNRFINQYAYEYVPSNYSNLAKGMFTIPNVGSHVWLFFVEGNPNMPIYFAVSYGQEDWKRIYSTQQTTDSIDKFNSSDYPESYENIGKTENGVLDADTKTFKSKTVYNSNKHTIELVDTDNKEILKLTHYSGSFKEFNNVANIELATKNDQKMVIGDQFLTVQKNQSVYVAGAQEIITGGDQYITVGSNTKTEDVKKIKDSLKEIHEYKRLFDIMRAQKGIAPNEVSSLQNKAGVSAKCPICGGIGYKPNVQSWNFAPTLTFNITDPSQPLLIIGFQDAAMLEENGDFFGAFADTFGVQGIYAGDWCDCCNSKVIPPLERMPGFSPSTQDGIWTPEPHKQPGGTLDQLLISKSKEMLEVQRKLGEGDQIIEISKNKVENIGLVMNDLPSFRVDPVGKLRIGGMHVGMEETYGTFRRSPHVEYVAVDDVPGGDYNLTVGNKYKLLVGAKGINIKTFGPIDMYGTIVNLAGEQINISSQNEVLIDGGERFSIRARKIALIPFENNPVAVEGQLHVTRNMIVGGGSMTEGEVGLLHVTAPVEYQQTLNIACDSEFMPVFTSPMLDELFGLAFGVTPPVDGHSHFIPFHTHIFKNLPLKLLPTAEAVRKSMIDRGINDLGKIAAALGTTGISGLLPEVKMMVIATANQEALKLEKTAGFTSIGAIIQNTDGTQSITCNYNFDNNGSASGGHTGNGLSVTVTIKPAEIKGETPEVVNVTHKYR